MSHYQPYRDLAKAIRTGDRETAELVLDNLAEDRVNVIEQIAAGRAEADRMMRRDPPLPQLEQDWLTMSAVDRCEYLSSGYSKGGRKAA